MMKLSRRHFLILSGATVVSLSLPWYASGEAARIPVLTYHDISTQQREEGAVSPSLFAAQMEWLYGAGYRAIAFDEIRSLDTESMKRAVIITFDEGYASFMEYALPLFTDYGFKATINIIGKDTGVLRRGDGPRLSWDECRLLIKSGIVELGCHTYDLHIAFGTLSRAGALAVVNKRLPHDLALFQKVYTEELGRPARILAWPYGTYDDTSIEIAKRAGFHFILGSNNRYFMTDGSSSAIPRFTIDNKAPLLLFRNILERRL